MLDPTSSFHEHSPMQVEGVQVAAGIGGADGQVA